MLFDRRSVLQGIAFLSATACGFRSSAEQPVLTVPVFGKSPVSAKFLEMWDQFKINHIATVGRVIDNGNGNISHSEGQGYGLFLAELAGDKEAFISLLNWTESTLALEGVDLFAWLYDPDKSNTETDRNNASDGDVLIAWALQRASRQWDMPDLEMRSKAIRQAILDKLIVEVSGRQVLLPGYSGFNHSDRKVFNLSYYIWPALVAFSADTPDGQWSRVIQDGIWLLERSEFGPLNLPTDWSEVTPDGSVSPAEGWPPRFGADAVRIPLYLEMEGMAEHAKHITSFWNSRVQNGQPVPAWVNVLNGQSAEYQQSAGGLAVVSALTGATFVHDRAESDYYSDVLNLLVASI